MQVPKLVDRYMAGNTRLDKYITHELPFEQVCCPAPPAPPHPAPPQPRPTPPHPTKSGPASCFSLRKSCCTRITGK